MPADVAIVHYLEAPHLGGVELWLADLVSSPHFAGVPMIVVLGSSHMLSSEDRDRLLALLARNDVCVIESRGRGPRQRLDLLWRLRRELGRLGRRAATFNHASSLYSIALITAAALEFGSRDNFLVVHMNPADQRPGLRSSTRFAVAQLLAQLARSRLVGVSSKVLDRFSGFAKRGSLVIPAAVNEGSVRATLASDTAPGSASNGFEIFVVGRLDANKNLGLALRVLAAYRARDPRARLIVVGDGPDGARLQALARELGIAEQVEFLGFRSDVHALLWSRASCVISTSLSESLGLVTIEAQALGIPVVCSHATAPEAVYWPAALKRVGVDDPLEDWCEALDAVKGRRELDPDACLTRFLESPFSSEAVAKRYRELVANQTS